MYNKKDSQLTFLVKFTLKGSAKDYCMVYRPISKAISILDAGTHKTLYQETEVKLIGNNLIVEDFVLGSRIHLFINLIGNIELQIIGYRDEYTKSLFTGKNGGSSRVFFMIKPGMMEQRKTSEIYSLIEKQYEIVRLKMFKFTKQNLKQYIVNEKMQNNQNDWKNIQYLSSGACFGFQLKGDKILPRLRKMIGSENPIQAKKAQPQSIRAKYGLNIIQNCCHLSANEKNIQLELKFIFSNQIQEFKPILKNSCLCLIKPHIIQSKQAGEIIKKLLESEVHINCMRFDKLNPELILKYLDLYKFLPEYQQNVQHLNQGQCLLMEIGITSTKNVVEQFKKICGPYDPLYAKKISQKSIRSIFGLSRVFNAVHCTELSEDSQSELQILFQC